VNQALIKKHVFSRLSYWIAFGFGSGLSPWAPGTCGTLVAIPLYVALTFLPTIFYFFVVLCAFVLGVYISSIVTRELGVEDFSGVVWDEIVGYWLTMLFVPVHPIWMLVGFILFRLFDITKPFPIRWVEKRVQGGLGIMLDDVLAAVPAWIILQCICRFYEGSIV
jgi:phosphatidylglycerophosphatase A